LSSTPIVCGEYVVNFDEYLRRYHDCLKDGLLERIKGVLSPTVGTVLSAGLWTLTRTCLTSWPEAWPGGCIAYVLSNERHTTIPHQRGRRLLTDFGDAYAKKHPGPQVVATSAKPIRLKLSGLGDHAFVKFYGGASLALEEVDLFRTCQPLDMGDLRHNFGFACDA
jgi:hypothetical protein